MRYGPMNMLNPKRFSRIWNAGQQGLVGADATAVMLEDRQFEITGVNSSDDDVTNADDQGLLLTTDGTAADQIWIGPSTAGDNRSIFREYNWGPENETEFETVIRTGAWANSVLYVAGWNLTMPTTWVAGDDNDRICFRALQGTDTFWTAVVNIGGTDHLGISTVPILATTSYHLAIRTDIHRRPHFSVNGVEFYVGPPCTADTALLPFVGIEEGSAAGKSMHVRSIACARNWGVN